MGKYRLGHNLLHFAELGSTNQYLKENGAELPHGTAVVADCQTAGKGRQGRAWSSPAGESLSLSVLLKDFDPQKLGVLPLLTGLAVTTALNEITGLCTGIKWSNDVVHEGKKLCGILCESRLSTSGSFAVVGIGLNVNQKAEHFSLLQLEYAKSLLMATHKKHEIAEIADKILLELEKTLQMFEKQGFAALRTLYEKRCVTLGQTVRLIGPQGEETGTALGIGDDGSLLCEIDGLRREISSGEVSVRGLYGYA